MTITVDMIYNSHQRWFISLWMISPKMQNEAPNVQITLFFVFTMSHVNAHLLYYDDDACWLMAAAMLLK